jgi:hypothetical protein
MNLDISAAAQRNAHKNVSFSTSFFKNTFDFFNRKKYSVSFDLTANRLNSKKIKTT